MDMELVQRVEKSRQEFLGVLVGYARRKEQEEAPHRCMCGRTVCCGKHKGCCHTKTSFVREKTL